MRGASSGKPSFNQKIFREVSTRRNSKNKKIYPREQKANWKSSCKTNAARDQPSRPHCSSTLRLPSRRLPRRDDGTGPKAPPLKQRSATFTGYCCRDGDSKNQRSATPAVASGPAQLKEWAMGEAAMSGQPARTRARSGYPWQFTLENYRSPPASPQSSFGQP